MKTSRRALTSLRRRVRATARARSAPATKLTISQWADAYRHLSSEASSESGRWHTERAPYQRGIMDAISEPMIERVVFMKSAQIGATEILNNVVGYFIDQDPAPILVMQETLEKARAWSTDRLATMLRDSPRLRGKVKDPRSRDTGNTILHKNFRGGHLTVVGANSPAGLSSRPIRVVLADDIDRYPHSAGTEGDPCSLAIKRTDTFWNRKVFLNSTPTVKDLSRIEEEFEQSDQRRYQVPCLECGEYQVLRWAGLHWPDGDPGGAFYVCEKCGAVIDESQKQQMLDRGQWVPTFPGRRIAGFHINALYSPFPGAAWGKLASDFLAAKGNPERLKAFVNTALGEVWEEQSERAPTDLESRREKYQAEVPRGAALLTAGVDIQPDRLELLVVGWGRGEESWRVHHEAIYGDPGRGEVWQTLLERVNRTWKHEAGADLRLSRCAIDSGYATEAVYRFVGPLQPRVFATKGLAQPSRPLLGKPSKANRYGVRLFPVGTETAKDVLFARMRIEAPGPGYLHFPSWLESEYFLQLGAEKAVTRWKRGRPLRRYEKIRPRNEALDLEVLALVALVSHGAPTLRDLGKLVEQAVAAGEAARKRTPAAGAPSPAPAPTARRPTRRRGGWVESWRT